MPPDTDAALGSGDDSTAGAVEIVTSVDATERAVVHTLDAIFHKHESTMAQLLQIVEKGRGHTVGPSADDQSHDVVDAQRLLIPLAQRGEVGIRVCIRLEVGEVLHVRIFTPEERLAFLQLLTNGFPRRAVLGIERLVVAIRAAAGTDAPVAIGAGEAGVHADFLSLAANLAGKPFTEIIIHPHYFVIHAAKIRNKYELTEENEK